MFKIITDSASDITLAEAQDMNIHVVPINIEFADGPCPQHTTEDFELFYDKLRVCEELPTTSQPSPDEYLKLFEEAKENGEDVLVLTLSSGLSGIVSAVNIAINLAEYDRIYVLDTQQAIAGQRIMTEYAVELRDKGLDIHTVITELEQLRNKITVNGMLDTLTYLRKGGRIPPSLAAVGNALRIKPLILLEDKILKNMGKAMGRDAGKKLLFKRFEQHIPDERFPLCFLYSSNRELGQQFMEETVKQFSLESYNIKLVPVGGVIGTHIGTDGIGFAYVMKETE